MALSGKSRGLPNTNRGQRPLIGGGHAGDAISNRTDTEEYRPRDRPVEKGTEIEEKKKNRETNKPRGGGQVEFFKHNKVVDFTKSPCGEMSRKEKESLGIGGLEINDTESDNDKSSYEALDKTPDVDEGPHMCRRVDTKSPKHKRSGEPRYQFDEEESLEIAIYQCEGDLKKFNERYDVEEKV